MIAAGILRKTCANAFPSPSNHFAPSLHGHRHGGFILNDTCIKAIVRRCPLGEIISIAGSFRFWRLRYLACHPGCWQCAFAVYPHFWPLVLDVAGTSCSPPYCICQLPTSRPFCQACTMAGFGVGDFSQGEWGCGARPQFSRASSACCDCAASPSTFTFMSFWRWHRLILAFLDLLTNAFQPTSQPSSSAGQCCFVPSLAFFALIRVSKVEFGNSACSMPPQFAGFGL